MRFIKNLFLATVAILLWIAGWGLWFALHPLQFSADRLDFSITPGAGLRQASQQMAEAGLGFSPWQFTLLARALGKAAEIKAGSYEVSRGISPWGVLEKLTRGDFTQGEITFIEGKTFRYYRTQLDQHPDLQHDTVGMADAEILSHLGAPEPHPEGLFFPDTYLFAKKTSDLDVLRRAYQTMRLHLAREWMQRNPAVPLTTPYEALIMASIVEKETGRAADRDAISAVFANRLRVRMLLQTDPTVIYGLGPEYDGNLRKRDLLTDTPYNTYTRAGLPPTPIAMPSLASLRAALHPADNAMLYFVARGDGSSEFSRNLDEHNRAVNKYQRGNK